MKQRLLSWRRRDGRAARAEERAALAVRRAEERAAVEAKRAEQRAAEAARRQEAALRRRQVAGELAAAALTWGLNAWIEGAMWLCLLGGLVVLYIGSYADLMATFAAFGYDPHISWLMPLGIDLPVTASVLAQMLAGRWRCHWSVRARLGLLTAVTAPLTLTGNALRGAIDGSTGQFTFEVQLWMDLVAFAVPGLGVVLIGYVASMMQGERAELQRRRLEAEASGASPATSRPEPTGPIRGQADRDGRPGRASETPGGVGRRSVRRPGREVQGLVLVAREQLRAELGREPSGEEIAARVTADGHPIAASRVRAYLAERRAEQRAAEDGAEEEVVAWRSR